MTRLPSEVENQFAQTQTETDCGFIPPLLSTGSQGDGAINREDDIRYLVFCLFALATMSHARAAVVTSANVARLNFDFATSVAQPPYDNINFQLEFGEDDYFGPLDSFNIQAFSAMGIAASGVLFQGPFVTPTSGFENGFGGPVGLFRRLNESTGYLQISSITGSFDLTGFRLLAHSDSNVPPIGTGWVRFPSANIEVSTLPTSVPEPHSLLLALLALGAGLVASKREPSKPLTSA